MAGHKYKKDFEAWEEAKRTHQLEHASGVEPTLSCDILGHYWDPSFHEDSYIGLFDDDTRRKFCIATNRPW